MIENQIKEYKNKIVNFLESDKFKKLLTGVSDEKFSNYLNYFIDFCKTGKCMRGYLVALGYAIATDKNLNLTDTTDDIILASICYEVFETAILAHDDIIDQSPTRRNQTSMYKYLGKENLGTYRAICLGDYGIMLSTYLLLFVNFPQDIKLKAIKHQEEIHLNTVIGELRDIDITASKTYTKEEIMEMYYYKTALYSIIGPITLGAILGGCNQQTIEWLNNIGKNLGYAYQIKDDILGIYGNESNLGKPTSSDIKEGKSTILAYIFTSLAPPELKNKFYEIYGNVKREISIQDIELIKDIFNSVNVKEQSETILNNYINNAFAEIEKSQFSDNAKLKLTEFANYLLNRTK